MLVKGALGWKKGTWVLEVYVHSMGNVVISHIMLWNVDMYFNHVKQILPKQINT